MRTRTLLVALGLTTAAASQALLWNISATLSGANEVPPNTSPAVGTSLGTFDDITGQLLLTTIGTGFVAPVTAAHIHQAPPGVAGPVIFPLTGAPGGMTYVSVDNFSLTPAQGLTLTTGGYYVNVHSQAFPGGEIRGQLAATAVPEPATMIALVAGAAALIRRRKK